MTSPFANALQRSMRNRVSLPTLALVPVLAGALLLLASCSGGATGNQARGPAPVTASTAVAKDVPIVVRAIGTVEAYKTISVKAQVGGELIRMAFQEGQDVKKGTILFEIDPRPYQAALDGALADLARDQAKLSSAEDDVRRYAELVKKDYVTQQQFTQVKANADALKATVEADKAAVQNARLNLGYCTVRAPIDGRTGTILVQQGNVIKANDAPVLTLNQVSPIYIDFSVPESDLADIRRRASEGTLKVDATLPDQPGEPFTGQLSFIDNSVNQATGTILLKATFENRNRSLWPGQFVNLSLVLRTDTGVVVVPTQAVQRGQEGEFLYVIKPDKTVDLRTVTVGQQLDGDSVIDKGVKAGETVVTDGQLRLYPGAKVAVTREPGTGEKGDS
ncbi:MAG: efflux RND transporter periplasmic adaptor subunit [Acidobacteria bacterium]|nr:efflux RND transporter periplasmic adaptor subunit [Acidobacteriota bacterium]